MSLIKLRAYIYLRGMIPYIEAWWPVAFEAIFQIKARGIKKGLPFLASSLLNLP